MRILNDGQISDVVEIDANLSVVVKVSEYREESRRSLDDVRDEIIFTLQSERALVMVEERARRMQEAVAEGQAFSAVAVELEATYSPLVSVGRLNQDMDRAILDSVFRAKKPGIGQVRLGSTVTTIGDYAVYKIDAVIPGRPETIPLAERDSRKQELQNQAGQADFGAFVGELLRRGDVEISDDALAEQELL